MINSIVFQNMRLLCLIVVCPAIALSTVVAQAADKEAKPIDVLLVVGAAGAEEFGDAFSKWSDVWQQTCDRAKLSLLTIHSTADEESSDRDQLQAALTTCADIDSERPLWIVLVGHGTWDGASAEFNLVGPDVNAKELGSWIDPIKRTLVIVNCASSSGPFINRLSGKNRIVVTATKSGSEKNYARFGKYFADAFGAIDGDLDHDDSISVREAFLKAATDANKFYQEEGRLATEHALLDDNDDKKGSSSTLVSGKAKSKGKAKVDGDLAGRVSIPATTKAIRLSEPQLVKRNRLESQLRDVQKKFANADKAKLRKNAMPILLELAKLYAEATKANEDKTE